MNISSSRPLAYGESWLSQNLSTFHWLQAASLETKISSHESKNIYNLEEREKSLIRTGRELSGSQDKLDSAALRRIEKEIFAIGDIVKTQCGDGSFGHVSYRLTNEVEARVTKLEVEKKELQMKLQIAREAMSEYVKHLNEKVRAWWEMQH